MQRVLRNQVICPRAECLSEVPLHVLFCELGGQRLHEKKFFKRIILSQQLSFTTKIEKEKEFYNTWRLKQKKGKIDVKSMFNRNFI